MPKPVTSLKSQEHMVQIDKEQVVGDYKIIFQSRHASLIGRREVLSGKAKFGIFGDGKEVAQLAMARHMRKGDWRSGYYRDQTVNLALGIITLRQFFAQLYADPDKEHDPASGGRQMGNHVASRFLDDDGKWRNQLTMHNSSSDISPIGAQMARLVGLGYASKLYRELDGLRDEIKFSNNGNEIAFGTSGDAGTSEGIFWEALNAIGVLQIPTIVSIWDDGYGISVPRHYQTTKDSISKIVRGFEREKGSNGFDIYLVKGWDYLGLLETYEKAATKARQDHIPAFIHVTELTQQQGHSTSGSHERYKSSQRMQYERDYDCVKRMREWMISAQIVSEAKLDELENKALAEVQEERQKAWDDLMQPMEEQKKRLTLIYDRLIPRCKNQEKTQKIRACFAFTPGVSRKLIATCARNALVHLKDESNAVTSELKQFVGEMMTESKARFNSNLLLEKGKSALAVRGTSPIFSENSQKIDGRLVINRCFDHLLASDPRVFIIGEDVGQLGGVNLEFEGLNAKYGELRVTNTGIREATILGQGIGAALRGLRPVVDIQYLDYLLYALQILSDDVASLHYRTAGGQIAPVIIRTKGHRLEGIWHSGSPIGLVINAVRGIHVCVPRNMVQAAGFYNTLMEGDEPALVIEVLNGYRRKELLPDNLAEYKIPLGTPEILRKGKDISIVTYGACIQVVEDALELLNELDIDAEVIDVQTLLPFDRQAIILESLKKTNSLLIVDEDVPGGASAFIMQKVLEDHGGYDYLDTKPKTLTAKAHRPPYGTDGDYFTKPNANDVVEMVYEVLRERDPQRFGEIY